MPADERSGTIPRDDAGNVRWSGRLVLLLIVAVAFGLRLWGITHGLPFTMDRPDEREALEHMVGFAAGDWSPHWFVYPNLFFWIVWGWIQAALAVLRTWNDVPSFNTLLGQDLGQLLLIGRLASVVTGTATVVLVHRVGRALGGPWVGGAAAAFVATNLLHVRESHALKADVYLTLAVPMALASLAAWVNDPRAGRAYGAGVRIGIATGLKYPGVLLLAPLWHADHLIAQASGRSRLWPTTVAMRAGIVATLVFMACCPSMFTDRDLFTTGFDFSVRAVYGVRPHMSPPPNASPLELVLWYASTRTFGYHAVVSLWHGCGALFALATPWAIATALRRSQPPLVRLGASFCLVYYGVISLSQVGQSRYLTPLVPVLALLISHALWGLAAHASRARSAAFVALAAAMMVQPAASSVAHDRLAAQTDTRGLALTWMQANLPPGAVVGRLGPGVFSLTAFEVPAGVRFVDVPTSATDLDAYGVTHAMSHDHPLPFSHVPSAQLATLAPRLEPLVTFDPFRGTARGSYEELDAYFIPYAGFDTIDRPGPRVHIYRWTPRR